MPRTLPSRPWTRRPLIGAIGLVLSALLGAGAGAFAAGSPSEAVETLVQRIVAGDFEDLGDLVCPELEDEIRGQFDPAASDATFGSVEVDIVDPVVTVLAEEADSAVVSLVGTMRITFDQERARELVRAQLESSGQTPTDEDVDRMLDLMFPSEGIPIDEQLTVVEREGAWLICDPGDSGRSFASAGMCGIVTPDEIGAFSPIELVSNVGEGDFCQWIAADENGYISIDVGLLRDTSLDDYREADPAAQELTVAGLPAIGSAGQLYVAVDGGVLSVVPYLADGPDPSADPIALAVDVAELVIPRLGQLPSPDVDDQPASPSGVGALVDCGTIDLEALNALSPVHYDSVSGSDGSCAFLSTDIEAGSPFLSVTFDTTSSIEDIDLLFPDGTEGEVDGHRSFAAVDILWVELDDGLLTVMPVFAGSPDAAGLDVYAYASDAARVVIAAIASGR
jgi:hypothetical protein